MPKMNDWIKGALAVPLLAIGSMPAVAQEAGTTPVAIAQGTLAPDTGSTASAAGVPAEPACELHIWPTENFIGMNTGLLSGFGALGALADLAAHDGKVKTVKELMADYLGPDIQIAELNRADLLRTLKLPASYRIVVEEPTPFNEELKNNPALKAHVKEMNATIKANRRLSGSKSSCYAELITTHIFYQKAMMYGSNLFTGWIFRDFGDQPLARRTGTGQVKNPLQVFPPKTPEAVEQAKAELRDAFSKDFSEYAVKKVPS
jgi:hypothetical protein